MKRVLSISLILAVLFSFVSCRNIDELNTGETTDTVTTTAAPPVVGEKKQTKEFKDKNGRTVYVVDVVLPEISENIEQYIIDYINSVSDRFFEDACVQAENNIESAAKFMDTQNSDKPWKRTISFETTYVSGYFVCFLISESLSFYGSSDNAPSVYTKCFQVQEGNSVNAAYFTDNPDTPEIALGYIADLLRSRAENGFYEEGLVLNENELAAFDEAVSLDGFCLTDNGMAFYVSKSAIDPYEMTDIYTEEFTWDELEGMFNKPELY
ncbi:MAG: hypothetical protein IJB16_09430 [Clostridia bacterium]|nr:hypothetical protein [Clostridia bacterium]